MKINSKTIIPFGFFVLNQIIQCNAQYSFSDMFHSPYLKAAKSSQTTITNEQLNSFSYGADQFKLAIIGDRYLILYNIKKKKKKKKKKLLLSLLLLYIIL